jgi:stalled ribosome alternative rescue factor ArfA
LTERQIKSKIEEKEKGLGSTERGEKDENQKTY